MYQLPQKPYGLFHKYPISFSAIHHSARMHFSFRYFYSVIQQTNGFIILATGNQIYQPPFFVFQSDKDIDESYHPPFVLHSVLTTD